MWQTLLLYQWRRIFAWLPIETMIHERQQEYYKVLGTSNDSDDSTEIIRFLLQAIWDTIEKYAVSDQDADQVSDQVNRLLHVLGMKTLSALDLMDLLELKHRPTFRKNYLHPAIEAGFIVMTLPQTPNARGQKYRKSPGGNG
jgi:Fic family protein